MKTTIALALLILLLAMSPASAQEKISEIRSPSGRYLLRIPDDWRVTRDRFQQRAESFQLVPVEGARVTGLVLPPTRGFDLAGEVKRDVVKLFGGLSWSGYEDPVAMQIGGHAAASASLDTSGDASGKQRHRIVVVDLGEGRLHLKISCVVGTSSAAAMSGFDRLVRSARIPAPEGEPGANEPEWREVTCAETLTFRAPGTWSVERTEIGVRVRDPEKKGLVSCTEEARAVDGDRGDLAAVAAVEDGWLELDGWDVASLSRKEVTVGGLRALRFDRRTTSTSRPARLWRSLAVRVGDRTFVLHCWRPDDAAGVALDRDFERVLGSVRAAKGAETAEARPVTLAGGKLRVVPPSGWRVDSATGDDTQVRFVAPGGAGFVSVRFGTNDATTPEELVATWFAVFKKAGYEAGEELGREPGRQDGDVTLRVGRLLRAGETENVARVFVRKGRGRMALIGLMRDRQALALDAAFDGVVTSLRWGVDDRPPPPTTIHGTWVGKGRDAQGRAFTSSMSLRPDATFVTRIVYESGGEEQFSGHYLADGTILRFVTKAGQSFFYSYRLSGDELVLSSPSDPKQSMTLTRQR